MFDGFTVTSKINGEYAVSFPKDLGAQLQVHQQQENTIFVIDERLLSLFEAELKPIIDCHRHVLVQCCEENKTVEYSLEVVRRLIAQNVRKTDALIAVGGGITQDIVAFIASILFRGIDWKFYPTTLLAQCDSCIGSKSSINFDQYKNLLGTFCPPSEIFIFPAFLQTLTASEIRSGIGEMLHYFFIDGIETASQVGQQFESLIKNRELLAPFISKSLQIKKKVIEVDEFDVSIRHIFNYGHTFGHAIEAITRYAIPHGQAISIGMDLANYISLQRGLMNRDQFDEMHQILDKNIPPFRIDNSNIDAYVNALSKDKKNKGNKLGCILSYGPGRVEKFFVDMDTDLRNLMISYSATFGK